MYTDFACHVGPIIIALRDRDIKAIGYYGKMKEIDKQDAYTKWKNDEVQVIVATRAFGLGINKPDVRFVIRNGLPPVLGRKNMVGQVEMVSKHMLTFYIVTMIYSTWGFGHEIWQGNIVPQT